MQVAPPGSPDFDARTFDAFIRRGHNGHLGMAFHAAGDGWIEIALPWKHDLAADEAGDVFASGPIIALMDMACGCAVWMRRAVALPQVTVDLRVDYMRPARPHRAVIGRAECYKLTRSIAFVRGMAYDEEPGDPVARVVGTFMLLDGPGT